MTNNGKMRTAKLRKNQKALRKGNLLVLRNFASGYHPAAPASKR